MNSVEMHPITNPLGALCYAQNVEMAELLIDKCANIHFKSIYGSTALFFAISNNNKPLVEFLLAKGSDVNANINGVSLLETAMFIGNPEIVKLLVKNSAQ